MTLEGLMIAHGGEGHVYGTPCKFCEEVFLENPYVESLIQKERNSLVEEIEMEVVTNESEKLVLINDGYHVVINGLLAYLKIKPILKTRK